jgi:hypothetical protein
VEADPLIECEISVILRNCHPLLTDTHTVRPKAIMIFKTEQLHDNQLLTGYSLHVCFGLEMHVVDKQRPADYASSSPHPSLL